MTWEQALERAIERSRATGRKWYVRGYQRTISDPGAWLYGAYAVPNPELTKANRPNRWW